MNMTLRQGVRHVRDLAQAWQVPGRLRRLAGPQLLVLTYHRVLPPDHGDWRVEQPGMLVTPGTFGKHLETLGQYFEFTDLEAWVRASKAGSRLPRLACAITFDDGWRDNYDHAFPVLRSAGVPATIFLVSDLVGTRYAFWPNRLARALAKVGDARELEAWPAALRRVLEAAGIPRAAGRGRVEREEADRAIERAKSMPDEELNRLLDLVPQEGGSQDGCRDLLDWNEIGEMGASGLVRFGSHTRRHTRLLEALDEATLVDEVVGSAEALERRLGYRPALFCYPNGDFGPSALQCVSRNYLAAVTTQGGWNTPATPRERLQRVGVHEDTTATLHGLLRRLDRARSAAT
jgi:peptidoglycan/xylan/chitin deacetylase (PgdA/CDA1 family)